MYLSHYKRAPRIARKIMQVFNLSTKIMVIKTSLWFLSCLNPKRGPEFVFCVQRKQQMCTFNKTTSGPGSARCTVFEGSRNFQGFTRFTEHLTGNGPSTPGRRAFIRLVLINPRLHNKVDVKYREWNVVRPQPASLGAVFRRNTG